MAFLRSIPAVYPQLHSLLSQGELCALPTETVYGLAAHGYQDQAVARIFEFKNRPTFNPLILHYASTPQIHADVLWSETADKLAKAFWPGPLTLILPRHPTCRVSRLASAGLSTLAVRVPAHPFLQGLLQHLSFPLAIPSANPSGYLSPTKAEHVRRMFSELPIVDGGPCQWGIESTVIDLTDLSPTLLRPGALSRSTLEQILETTLRDPSPQSPFHSPGLLPTHYAPQKPLRLNAVAVNSEEGLLAFGPHPLKGASVTLNLSPQGNVVEAACRLFGALHQLEIHSCKQIAVMPIPQEGLGVAINDRLTRACHQEQEEK